MPTPLHELQPRRLALIKPSSLGDIIHALPVLSALRDRFPHAHISWIVNDTYEGLLAGHPHLDATINFRRGRWHHGFWNAGRFAIDFVRRFRHERFDVVIDLQGLFRSGMMALVSGAPRRVGFADAREGATWCYTDTIEVPGVAQHAVDRLWHVAEAFGARGEKQFILPRHPTSEAWADQQLWLLPRPWMAMGVGARWQTKRWRVDHFVSLARRMQAVFGGSVVFVGGRDETPGALQVRSQLTGPSLDLTGRTNLPQLTALLARVDVMLANDTGPLHLAAALGRPVVAPYTCTQAALTGPYRQLNRAVETKVWCAGSLLKRCSRMECMSELTPARLWPALQEVLLTWHIRSRSA